MALGDQADVVRRLKAVLPPWFGSSNPVLSALLNGIAWALSTIYAQYAYAKLQTRIATATDGWLDLIAYDYFGRVVSRRAGQSDASFRAIIQASLLRERSTRAAIIKVLKDITGQTPRLIEPGRPYDTGAWDTVRGFWDVLGDGGWVWDEPYPFGFFVIAYRPAPASQWDGVTDADIYAAVDAVRAAGIKAWVQIHDA